MFTFCEAGRRAGTSPFCYCLENKIKIQLFRSQVQENVEEVKKLQRKILNAAHKSEAEHARLMTYMLPLLNLLKIFAN